MDDLTITALAHHAAKHLRDDDGEAAARHSVETYEAWAKGVIVALVELADGLDPDPLGASSVDLPELLELLTIRLTDAEVAATPDPKDWPVASHEVEQALLEQEARGA